IRPDPSKAVSLQLSLYDGQSAAQRASSHEIAPLILDGVAHLVRDGVRDGKVGYVLLVDDACRPMSLVDLPVHPTLGEVHRVGRYLTAVEVGTAEKCWLKAFRLGRVADRRAV